jgi:tetratricopeptide (TPR) repeat protein
MNRLLVLTALIALSINSTFAQKKGSTGKPTIALADSLYNLRDYQSAVSVYRAVLKNKADANNVLGWNKLGNSYHNLKDYSNALAAYEQVQRINPGLPGFRINLARVYAANGDVEKSIQTLDRAITKGFGNYKILESDPEFENLRTHTRFKEIRDRVYAAAYPCLNLPGAREFDFWLGDWDVYLTSNLNIKTGFNRITQASGGCVILESWEAVGPHNGMSINYLDASTGKWKQYWAGSGRDITEFYDGEYIDRAMRFKWDVTMPDGTTRKGKLTFTNMEPGKVRQYSEQSSDGGKTWQAVYDFTYIKRNN